jgi:hypothetical protein
MSKAAIIIYSIHSLLELHFPFQKGKATEMIEKSVASAKGEKHVA